MIAVTGGVAEGKSTVLGYLRAFGLSTLSADDVARDCLAEPEPQAFLRARLGSTEPSLIRRALSDVDFRRDLNQLMHPMVLNRILDSGAQAVEVPLLIESCTHHLFPIVWVVTCGAEEQSRRLAERLGSPAAALDFMRIQLPTDVKIPFADTVVRTNFPEESVRAYVFEAVHDLSKQFALE